MIFKNNDDEARVVIATCNCGCNSEIHVMHYKNDPELPEEYYVSLHSSKFDDEQLGIFGVLKRRLKRAWYNLLGKDYLYMDIVFSRQEFVQFADLMQSMTKTVKK